MQREYMRDCDIQPDQCPNCWYVVPSLRPEMGYSRDIPYEEAVSKELGDYILAALQENGAQSAFVHGNTVYDEEQPRFAEEHIPIIPIEFWEPIASEATEDMLPNGVLDLQPDPSIVDDLEAEPWTNCTNLVCMQSPSLQRKLVVLLHTTSITINLTIYRF